MTPRTARFRTVLTALAAWSALAGAALAGASPVNAVEDGTRIAPGVLYKEFDLRAAKGVTHVHLLTVDLRDSRTGVGLLYPGVVASREPVSRLADARGAVAGVNGDFFNITETQHPGIEADRKSVV